MPQTDGKQVATTKLTSSRTTTVPSAIRNAENLEPGSELEWRLIDDEWVLRPLADSEGGE